MKIGICTGGGDCPGLNAVIRAVVKAATHHGASTVIGIEDSFNGLMYRPMRTRPLALADVTDILARGGTILGTHNTGSPFKDPARREQAIRDTIAGAESLGLDGTIVVGGEGTQEMSAELIQAGMKIIGIPKTIDNDLPGTERTVGFTTAVDIVSEAVMRLRSTAESHDRIMVLEVMGRDSGYIALHGGLAGGANIILLPEIPFDYDEVCAKIVERQALGRNFSVVVVAEGASERAGSPTYKASSSGQSLLGGIGHRVAHELYLRTKIETRTTVLGHVQRGGPPNSADRILATCFGVHAVKMAIEKKYGRFVAVQNGRITDVAYNSINPGKREAIGLDDQTLIAAETIGISLGRKPH